MQGQGRSCARVFAPKGRNNKAQGNALGTGGSIPIPFSSPALKGHNNSCCALSGREQGGNASSSQGVALGSVIAPLRGEDSSNIISLALAPSRKWRNERSPAELFAHQPGSELQCLGELCGFLAAGLRH